MMISETRIRDDEKNTDDSSSFLSSIETMLEALLRDPAQIDWKTVHHLLSELAVALHHASADSTSSATRDHDPLVLGPSLLNILLSRNPPFNVVDVMLQVFPDSLGQNTVAFFAACRLATAQTVTTQLMNHSLQTSTSSTTTSTTTDNTSIFSASIIILTEEECPYPWILSNHVSVEGAKAMLQAYPQGVLQTSSYLSSLCPLDFFLMSPEMIKQRNFDRNIWTKFKLMLVAADCCDEERNHENNPDGISPIHVILKRILSRPGM
jgi:hypothetical protein